MESFSQGLRCQDVHSGLRNLDPNSSLLAPLGDTRVVGMAATLAGLIRGLDVVENADALKQVAAHQLDVDLLAFNEVISVLEQAGFVEGVQRRGNKITSFTESVPYYEDLYAKLGTSWNEREPTELEQQVLLVVDGLAAAPIPLEELGDRLSLDSSAMPLLLDVGDKSGLVRKVDTPDGPIGYSPFFGFENPQLLGDLVRQHGSGQLAEEFDAVRHEQGLAIDPVRYPMLTSAVAGGLIMAPSVQRPDGQQQAFAALPYVSDARLLTARKPVLDKALAVLACLRCAERFGGYTSLTKEGLVNVIDKLLDSNRGILAPHGSHERQYQLMYQAGLIAFDPDSMPGGSWVRPRFIDTEDNRAAMRLARDLLTHGEGVERRVDDTEARKALELGSTYSAPMQTMHRTRAVAALSQRDFRKVFEAAMGRKAL